MRQYEARSAWTEQLDDAVRGLASGFLIGIPVVFTVDSWWLGDQIGPLDALALLAFNYLLTLAACYWIGFHRGLRRGWEYLADALEAQALAILALIAVFWALGQVGDGQPPSVALGRLAVAAPPVSLGVAIANHYLPRDASRSAPDAGDASAMRELHGRKRRWRHGQTISELAAAIAGALFLCVSIVPIDDFNALVTQVPFRNLPWVILLSLIVSYTVVFAAGFAGERRRHQMIGVLQHPLTETVVAYVAALAVSFMVLWTFGRIGPHSSFMEIYTRSVLLAFPASMAAAAGRLAV